MVWCLPNGLGRRLAQHLGSFFHQMKVLQHIERKVSKQAVCRGDRRDFCIKHQRTLNFFKIQEHSYPQEEILMGSFENEESLITSGFVMYIWTF
jgi:hypothetical protein